jgi:protein-tyrosine phosphatase
MDCIADKPRSYWVVEGKLAAGAHPLYDRQQDINPSLEELLANGFDSFIDLTRPAEILSAEYGEGLSNSSRHVVGAIHYRRFEIPDMSVPTIDQMADVLDYLEREIDLGRRVYLHCYAGLGRTGTVVGCYLCRSGVPGDQALDALAELRRVQGAPGSSPETEEQRDFVAAWDQVDPASSFEPIG